MGSVAAYGWLVLCEAIKNRQHLANLHTGGCYRLITYEGDQSYSKQRQLPALGADRIAVEILFALRVISFS